MIRAGTVDPMMALARWSIPLTVVAALAACGGSQGSGDPLIQTGQIVGGGTKQMSGNVQPVGGFLPAPQLLVPGGDGEPDLVYRASPARLASYNKIMLDPVSLWAAANSELNSIPADQQVNLANTFTNDLYQAMAKSCQMVRESSPGAIRIKVALVDTVSTNAALTTVAIYAPYVNGVYNADAFLFHNGVGRFAGTATAEAYAVDARDGTVLLEAVDKRGGTTAAVEDTFDKWLDVHHAFEAWSAEFVAGLQRNGICKAQ